MTFGIALSRLRLRLAAAFALTFAVALSLVAIFSLGGLWRESTHRLDRRMAALTVRLQEAVRREYAETPDSSFAFVVNEVRRDWVHSGDDWLILDRVGQLTATTAPQPVTRRVLDAFQRRSHRKDGNGIIESDRQGEDLRGAVRAVRDSGAPGAYTIIAFGSTEGIERDTEQLAVTLALATPLILGLSLAGGYAMARRALQPVEALGEAIDGIGPRDLTSRLPVRAPADEIDRLATRFNSLLSRLDAAQVQNQHFVREAAHQIRTPLTLVLGEADHALTVPNRSASEYAEALARIRTASLQMRRRVDGLFLLAEAEAGTTIERPDMVELDGLLLGCVDLFRSRATQLGRSLAFGVVTPAVVVGNEGLLREAVLELLENACRHGQKGVPVQVTLTVANLHARIGVESGQADLHARAPGAGLGQRIVRWIAEGHNGTFGVAPMAHGADATTYMAWVELPLAEGAG